MPEDSLNREILQPCAITGRAGKGLQNPKEKHETPLIVKSGGGECVQGWGLDVPGSRDL